MAQESKSSAVVPLRHAMVAITFAYEDRKNKNVVQSHA